MAARARDECTVNNEDACATIRLRLVGVTRSEVQVACAPRCVEVRVGGAKQRVFVIDLPGDVADNPMCAFRDGDGAIALRITVAKVQSGSWTESIRVRRRRVRESPAARAGEVSEPAPPRPVDDGSPSDAELIRAAEEMGEVLLFVRHGEREVPVQLPQDATVGHLKQAAMKALSEEKGRVSYQGKTLEDDDATLADCGVSMQARIEFIQSPAWEPIEHKKTLEQTECHVFETWIWFKFRLQGEVHLVVLMRGHFGEDVMLGGYNGKSVGKEFKIGSTDLQVSGDELMIDGVSFFSKPCVPE